MIATKEKAVEIIKYMPDDRMDFIITMLEALAGDNGSDNEDKLSKRKAFFSVAGNIDIDSDAICNLRKESLI